ncbi:tetratricopeptide repeat protein [bacterium]|nr:MAG: tetratricopeptide repeat protein [bacterium]
MRARAALLAAALAAACVPKTAARRPETPSAPPPLVSRPKEHSRVDARRLALLARLGDPSALSDLLRPDDLDGPLLSGVAVEAYAEGLELKAVLFAQAALGADPGNAARRKLLNVLALDTGIPFDPDGVLPRAALVQHELTRAEAAFFERRFGAAAQFCRRALLVGPEDPEAWTRLGSSYYAVGDEERAKQAYAKARALRPGDEALARFLAEKGWAQ